MAAGVAREAGLKRLAPFFSYYGSKHRIAGRYPTPVTGHIIEPFAGSAAYACRHPRLNVTLIDKHPGVAAVWRYLIRTPASEIRALRLLSPEEGPEALGDVPEEARLLVGRWLTKGSGFVVTKPSPWRTAHFGEWEHKSSFWGPFIRERIASQVDRIRHWRIIEGDYRDAPDVRADWFVDPPYVVEGRGYGLHGSRALDFHALALWCQERQGQVMVCESGAGAADWLPFRPFCRVLAMKSRVTKEVVWHRCDVSPAQTSLFDLLA